MAPSTTTERSAHVELPLEQRRVKIDLTKFPKQKVPNEQLQFGRIFTDHMLTVEWTRNVGWGAPSIHPYGNLSIPPSASVLHYGIECFEGLKAYKDRNGVVRLFRPEANMDRFLASAQRLALPLFDPKELLDLIKELIRTDSSWIPELPGYSLYIRPTLIGMQESLGVAPSNKALLFVICCPVGPYYQTGFSAISLYAENRFVRAWPGGTGCYKLGANYAPGILPQLQAAPNGYQQILWIFGSDHLITEFGTTNCFVFLKNELGEDELVTPSLADGTILPGVTRDSVLKLARAWNEFKVSERNITMLELTTAINDGRLYEIFGSGTAAVISPIKKIHYKGRDWIIPLDPNDPDSQAGPLARRFWETITKIQYGELSHQWSVIVD